MITLDTTQWYPQVIRMRVIVDACHNNVKKRSGFVFKVTTVISLVLVVRILFPIPFIKGMGLACCYIPDIAKVQIRRIFTSFCLPTDPEVKSFKSTHLDLALQMILVEVQYWNSTDGNLQRYERTTVDAPWVRVGNPIEVTIGKNGIGWVDSVDYSSYMQELDAYKEGKVDYRSPAGIFRLGTAFGDRSKGNKIHFYDYKEIDERHSCVYSTESMYFNQIVQTRQVSDQQLSGSFTLDNWDGIFELGVLIQPPRNVSDPETFGCLFLHAWDGRRLGTTGSTEMDVRNLEDIVYWLDRDKNPVLVQLVSRDVPLIPNLPQNSTVPPPDSLTADREW